MRKSLGAAFAIAVTLATLPASAQQTSAPPAASGLPAIRHLVYQFGYNTKAADSGQGTGTTTIDIVGLASDGGMTVNATDNWWNTVRPRQTYSCEVYSNGGVTCAKAPNAISPIQIAVVPLLGQNFFTPLNGGPKSTWKQSYNVSATFAPIASSGFAGQVHTWKCDITLTGKGPVENGGGHPLDLIAAKGQMKQQSGRQIIVNQEANILFDPQLQMPVYVNEAITFIPKLTTNQYTVELKLIKKS